MWFPVRVPLRSTATSFGRKKTLWYTYHMNRYAYRCRRYMYRCRRYMYRCRRYMYRWYFTIHVSFITIYVSLQRYIYRYHWYMYRWLWGTVSQQYGVPNYTPPPFLIRWSCFMFINGSWTEKASKSSRCCTLGGWCGRIGASPCTWSNKPSEVVSAR